MIKAVCKDIDYNNVSQRFKNDISSNLSDAIMQRNNYLYLIPRRLCQKVAAAIQQLNVPEVFLGGMLSHLYVGMEELYRNFRWDLMTMKMEESPSHLYGDLSEAAIADIKSQEKNKKEEIKENHIRNIQMSKIKDANFKLDEIGDKTENGIIGVSYEKFIKHPDMLKLFLENFMQDCGKDIFIEKLMNLNKDSSSSSMTDRNDDLALEPVVLVPSANASHFDNNELNVLNDNLNVTREDISENVLQLHHASSFKSISSLSSESAENIETAVVKNMSNYNDMFNMKTIQTFLPNVTEDQLKLFNEYVPTAARELKSPKFCDDLSHYMKNTKFPLREYQKVAIDEAAVGDNVIFVAPTGSGKTKIFVECARYYFLI